MIRNKICNFITLYRLPSQTKDKFEILFKDLDIINKSPFLTVVLGDFNTRSKIQYRNDMRTFEGSKIDIATSSFGLSQIINEPTHVLNNSLSRIGLIFTSQPNLVMHSVVDPLHLVIIKSLFSKFNVKIYFPPLYQRLVWHFQHANI